MQRRDCFGLHDIAKKVYRIAEENMEKAGEKMALPEDAFKFFVLNKTGEMDLYLCEYMDNESFIYAAYLGMLGRKPEPRALEKWMAYKDMPRFKFRKKMIDNIMKSAEFRAKGVIVRNNIYSDDVNRNAIW